MKKYLTLLAAFCTFHQLNAEPIPQKIQQIMDKEKYRHSIWSLYFVDPESQKILYDLNSNLLFSPASTSKLFSVASLFHGYGTDYRFKTPIYVIGDIQDGVLEGGIILVGQGDLTFGGRQEGPDKIAYTELDHVNANEVPGAILTPQDPLTAIKSLAKQIRSKGIKTIKGEIWVDDRLFETTEKRGSAISPIFINENLIDLVFNPAEIGQTAKLMWRPQVEGTHVKNEVKTVDKGDKLSIDISVDESGKNILVKGTIPLDKKDIVRTAPIKNPVEFARAALIEALQEQGITIDSPKNPQPLPAENTFENLKPFALWTSPPLSQYGILILKVSHNTGANLIPLLLAVKEGKKTYPEGMLLLGKFLTDTVKIPETETVFGDAAGGDENRITPKAAIQLLEYERKLPQEQFKPFYDGLPILGVDGSLEEFGINTPGKGKVHSKPGTGVSYNLADGKLFLTTQALSGYIDGQNGHLWEYYVVVNNGNISTIEDIFPIFEEESLISSILYEHTK